MRIRTLVAADVPRYRQLMLEAYRTAADAFTSTAEERSLEPISWWVARIAHPQGLSVAFGAEEEDRLVGAVALEYSARPKIQHTALLIGMVVREPARGQGVGRALLAAAIDHAAQRPGVQIILLTVTEGNTAAIHLYQQAGFQVWGIQPLAIATPACYKRKVHMAYRLPDPGQAAMA